MIRTILIDDEKRSRDSLEKLLVNYCQDIEILAKVESVDLAIKAIDELNPDVVFLDIQMPEKDGFALLEHYKNLPFKVIFTTAFNEYAIKAIKWAALDYLLKPIDIDELQVAVQKVTDQKELVNEDHAQVLNDAKNGKNVDKLVVAVPNGFKIIKLSEIIRFEAAGNYSEIYLENKQRILSSKTIKEFEDLLTGKRFFRLHRSHLISLEFIEEFKKGRSAVVIMADGKEIALSRDRKSDFLKLF